MPRPKIRHFFLQEALKRLVSGRFAQLSFENNLCIDEQTNMLKTPIFSHLTEKYSEDVYEPAEDTFLLLDALEADMDFLVQLRPLICLEVGTGSGIVLTSLATIIGKNAAYLATDVNCKAACCSVETGLINGVNFDAVIDDLGRSMIPRLQNMVDVLVFNPPYVVTPSDEVGSKSLEAAWAGGIDGREVIDRFLPIAANMISRNGVMYMVLIDKNKPEEVKNDMEVLGLKGEIVVKRKAGIENLMIMKFKKL